MLYKYAVKDHYLLVLVVRLELTLPKETDFKSATSTIPSNEVLCFIYFM